MNFAERMETLESDPRIGKVRHRMTNTYHVPGPRPPLPPEDRLRHYLVNQRDYEPDRYEGHGLTPEAVIAEASAHFAGINKGDGFTPFDVTIWEGDMVVAVLHAVGDGVGSYLVTRITWPETVTAATLPPAPDKPRFSAEALWTAESSSSVLYQDRLSDQTLDGMLATVLPGRHHEDVAIWRGSKLVAYVQAMADHTATATVVPPVDVSSR